MLPTDFVIVGAGLAGISLGVRLSEDPRITVTVLEAGGASFHDVNIDTPAFFLNNLGNTTKDWSFLSTSQSNLGGRSISLPRGKSIGGSSLINFMEAIRAPSKEYDAFESLGSNGWTWDNLLPFFKKAETLIYEEEQAEEDDMKFTPEFQGTMGPVERTIPRFLDVVAMPFLKTSQLVLGIKANTDPSYYEPHMSRPNLNVITGAQATKIVTSRKDSDVIASGVQYMKNGQVKTINATREVILSAGSYQSPQLLELSGIGDPAVLENFGIPVVVDLPGVGNNLRGYITQTLEHVSASYTAKLIPGLDAWENMSDPIFAQKQEEIYKETGGGMLSGIASSAFAFLTFKDFDTDGIIASLVQKAPGLDSKTHLLQKGWVNDTNVPFLELSGFDRFLPGATGVPEPQTNYASASIILLHPFSRGSVHLNSSNPLVQPNIDINLLDSEIDMNIIVKGYKLIRRIFQTAPLKDIINGEVSPGADVQSDEDLAAYARKTAGVTFHPIATSSMLPREDGGVVDANFKVYGTENLRVVDASIIPISISAHLQATIYAIAEKAACAIQKEINE
ncbi:hypothetical protein C0995_009768 [Termitomyces sp. Mi166|nr:hypothetical protein C0995_009768 [Termitomyces sp. Mi166\